MPTREEQQRWAVDLATSRQRSRRRDAVPLGIRKAQIGDQMEYAKNRLLAASLSRDKRAIREMTDRLIELRGAQTALALEEYEAMFGRVETPALELELRRYYRDCAALRIAMDSPMP
jgi:hypothetical protein